MPEISFICTLHQVGDDYYNEKLFGKLVTDQIIDDNTGLDLEIKERLEECIDNFNAVYRYGLTIYKFGILGVITGYVTSNEDREIFDVYIDDIHQKFYLFEKMINI